MEAWYDEIDAGRYDPERLTNNQMTKHKITYLRREEKVSQKTNKAYTSLSLKLSSYGDRYISGFGNKDNGHWVQGMELTDDDILIEETEPNEQGKQYLNFKTPKKEDVLEKRLADLEAWKKKVIELFPKMNV